MSETILIETTGAHSFVDDNGLRWTACCECNRGGNGNDADKCSAGWQCTSWNGQGCFIGTPIIGERAKPKKLTRSQARYRRYLEYGDCFETFIDYCRWDSDPDRDWNTGGNAQ